MSPETPQFNPTERLPLGTKIPDTPEFKAATAKLDAENAANAENRQQQAKMKHARIIPPEEAAKMRAVWEEEIRKKQEQIKNMN